MNRAGSRLAIALATGLALIFLQGSPLLAQNEEPQLVDSVEEHQKKLETLISERLGAVVHNRNFVLRLLVFGKPIEVPVSERERKSVELPGFRRTGVAVQRTIEKFQIDRITVRILINEDMAEPEQEYIRSIVPLLAEFRPERGDELVLKVVPPAPKKVEAEEEPGGPLGLDTMDLVLIGALGLVTLLLLLLLIKMMRRPKQEPAAAAPVLQPAPALPDTSQAAEKARKEEEEALKVREQEELVNTLRHAVVKSLFARSEMGQELFTSWLDKPDNVGGLIHALGPTIARKAMLPHMERERYKGLEETVLTEKKPPTLEKQITLLKEANLFLVTQDLAKPEQIQANPFVFLKELSWGQIGHLVKEEPVNIKAIVLSRIGPGDTARIMESMPKEMQVEVAVQIGNLHSLPLDMAESVARDLAVKARALPDAATVDIVGPQTLVDVLGRASQDTSTYLLNAMKSKDTKLSDAVEKKFFLFDAIPFVPPDLLPQVIRAMPSAVVMQALSGADPDIQRPVIMAFPEQARAGLVNTLRASQFDEETIMEARRQVVSRFQAMAERGKIDLKQISDAWQAKAS